MKNNTVCSVIIHSTDDKGMYALANRVSSFHIELIERRLNQSNLTQVQKITVIDKIIESLESQLGNSIIE